MRFQLEWAILESSIFSITAGIQICSWVDVIKEAQVQNMDTPSDPCLALDFYTDVFQIC